MKALGNAPAMGHYVEQNDDGTAWTLHDGGRLQGRVALLRGGHWSFSDPTCSLQCVAAVGEILAEIPASWPAPARFSEIAAKIYREAGADLTVYLPWAPALIAEVYSGDAEAQARQAMLLRSLLMHYDEPGLLPTRLLLEKQAYKRLSELHEQEPAAGGRLPPMTEALKSAFRAWHATVTNDDRAWYFGAADPQAQRETEMWDILTVTDGESRRLRRLFRETRDGLETVRRLIERWFLPRYDLQSAELLKAALRGLPGDGQTAGVLGERPAPLIRIAAASQKLTLLIALGYTIWWAVSLSQSAAGSAPPQPLLILWVVYLLCGGPPVLAWLAGGTPDTSTPRLLAGILVALIAVIMQQNWAGLATFTQTEPLLAALLEVAIVIAAFKVLLGKVRHTTGIESALADRSPNGMLGLARAWWRDTAVRRCQAVWTRGLALAFLLSLFVSDLLGDIYLKPAACQAYTCFPGAVGHTFPGLVLLFTALLLFAGVFVQLLWEEKPITEGIA